MNLVIDIGNTLTKYSVFINGEEIFLDKTEGFSVEKLNEILLCYTDIKAGIVSSVGNIEIDAIEKLFKDKYFMVLNDKTILPLKINYSTPSTLGKDRIAAAVGANALFPGNNILIIDAGTAITYDFVSAEGNYEGGNISPGLNTRFKSLHHFTRKLPMVSAKEPYVLTGKSTDQAISSGVMFGMIYEILGYIHEYDKIYENLRIILTGGDAYYFEKKLKNSIFVILNLNMIGLNRILELYVVKN